MLTDAGLLSSPYTKAKLLSNGLLSKKVTVKLQAASESSIEMIQKAGGSFQKVEQIKRQPKERSTNNK